MTLGTVHEVARGVFGYVQPDGSWFINNTGFLVGADGLTLIDTCGTERRTRAFLAAARGVTGAPVARLLLTHHHADHVNGNGLVGAATIIGHEKTYAKLISPPAPRPGPEIIDPIDAGRVEPTPPDVVYSERLTVRAGGRELLMSYVGEPAHTDNDNTVWLPAERVLFAGDLVMHGSMPLAAGGSIAGILRVLGRLRALDPLVVVPGHGEVGGPELLDKMTRFYGLVAGLAEAATAAGQTPMEAARAADLGEFAGMLCRERIVANLHRAMLEGGAASLEPITEKLLFGMMRDYNGGPLRCVA